MKCGRRLIAVIQVAALGQFIFGSFLTAVAVRETAVAAVYQKCLRLSTAATGAPSAGAAPVRGCFSPA